MKKIENLIIVAHPDDEVLWLNPILRKPNTAVVICSQNVYSLDTESLNYAAKVCQIIKAYREKLGIPIIWLQTMKTAPHFCKPNPILEELYKQGLAPIIELLNPKRIYTHNPWGEYGHPEHMLLHNVVHRIRKDIIFSDITITLKRKKDSESPCPPPNTDEIAKTFSEKLKVHSVEHSDPNFIKDLLAEYKSRGLGGGPVSYFEKSLPTDQNEKKFFCYK